MNRTKVLIFIAVVLVGLVITEYYPALKFLLKKEIKISAFVITRPEGFNIIGDDTMFSIQEPVLFHFSRRKNGKEVLQGYKKYNESRGIISSHDTIKVGCKTGISLITVPPAELNWAELNLIYNSKILTYIRSTICDC